MKTRLASPGGLFAQIVVALIGGYVIYPSIAGREVPTIAAKRADLVQTIVATGRVITPSRVELGPVVVGTVSQVNVREGDSVKAGTVLAVLKDDELRAAVAQASGALAEAEARVAQLGSLTAPLAEQSLMQAEANFTWARDELDRTRRLAERGFFSAAKVEEAERNAAVARAARDSALAQTAANCPQGSDYALAAARRAQAKASLDAAQSRLDNASIRTPVAGTVLKRHVEPGDVVQAGKTLFELASVGETQLVLQVDEKSLSSLRLNQNAMAVADAYPSERFAARIVYIAPGIDAQRGSVEVKLAVAAPPSFLKPDMTVSVEIGAGRAENALVVPAEMIREPSSVSPWVLVVRDGIAVRQSVKLGLRGSGQLQVVEGLNEGERLIAPTIPVVPGANVRAIDVTATSGPVLKAQEIIR